MIPGLTRDIPPAKHAFMRWLLLVLLLLAPMAQACGERTDCVLPNGTYRLAMPANWDGRPLGAVLFLNGWLGTSEGLMAADFFVRRITDQGIALIVPQAEQGTWSFPNSPVPIRDDFAFLDAVMEDVADRIPLRRDRVMVSGFSLGGSLAWSMACHQGEKFAGYLAISGTYWDPLPESCPSDIPILLHIHGLTDPTVPITGKTVGDWRMADARLSLHRWRVQGACDGTNPPRRTDGPLTCQRWRDCGGGVLEFCTHEAGHSLRSSWVVRGWEQLSQIKGWE